ncbi:hypothetical protein HPHPP23_0297 [Helicobacter pylori Hp P-23]|nr:hypothetical protein HPHPH27_0366 [Helicobacter pylori Hp H-27]EJC13879.1 hypothetical protein HPHPP23_0297 [Helicobacter pylori Hp P-23]EJC16006.1 hypothetical protein HPHPP74_0810 [Helicobacter pylori Hp P-74]
MRHSLQLKDLRATKPTHQIDSLYFKSQCPNAMTIITRKRPNPHNQKLGTYGVVLQKSKKVSTP